MRHTNTSLSIRTKIFRSMTLTTTGLMLLLTAATSLMYYSYFLKSTSDSSLAQLDYIAGQLNYYMDSVSNYSLSLITDDTIQKGLKKYKDAPSQFSATDEMQMKNSINHTIQSTPFIYSVTFYSGNHNRVATTEYYASTYMADVPASEDGVWFLQQKRSNIDKNLTLYTLSMIQPVYSIATGSLVGFIEISIPESTISDIYADNTDQNHHIYVTDKHGIVKSTDESLDIESVYGDFTTEVRDISIKNITFTRYLPRLDWYIINSVSFATFFFPLMQILMLCLLAAIFCAGICFVISRKLSRTITFPLYSLIDHTQKIKQGDWSTIDVRCNDRDIALLFSEFNAMIQAQEQLKDNLLETTKLKNQISLDLIQQQVKPHFLYNTLDNICSLAELDEKQTLIDIVMSLSTFYRVGLSSGKFHVTIKDELEITTAYLHIMQIRYFHKFDYTIHCPDPLKKYSCIKLLLQPIVENSIYHGIKELDARGHLEIKVLDQGENLAITVQDNGVGFTQEAYEKIWECSSHFGIRNIHQRIQLYYGEDYGLTMANRPEGGCTTTITIPKKEGTDHADNTTDC
ncbi:sensor histidine kinase [Luxibacter massiliensis]|uniref:sensor histidine kinase n=1 Tax=Luxibacter massiliensis TaxID=2219695 RepID=UPI000F048EE4|nr:sensor histidine kinase [Luxibacter massiliensis]